MKTLFIISVVFFFIWIVLKIHKKIWIKNTNQKQPQNVIAEKSLIIKKNSWLYPDDEFGKMEKGVVSETSTNVNGNVEIDKDNTNDLDDEIIEFWH
jgi:hypothetical protein